MTTITGDPTLFSWGERLQAGMAEAGMLFSSDVIGFSVVAMVNGELTILVPRPFHLEIGREEIQAALAKMGCPAQRFRIIQVAA